MRRSLPLVAVALAVALVGPLSAAADSAGTVDVPKLFRPVLPKIRHRSHVTVLLPQRIDTGISSGSVRGTWVAGTGTYNLRINAGRNCHGASACFIAAFLAQRGGQTSGGSPVTLAGRHHGRFHRRSCRRSSCAPPSIEWVEHGVLYTLQYSRPSNSQAKSALKALANSAIGGGAR